MARRIAKSIAGKALKGTMDKIEEHANEESEYYDEEEEDDISAFEQYS